MANHIELTHEELQRRIEILKKQDFYKGKSYFPELKSKSIEERFEDCVEQIKEYGWPDFNYMVYGMDVKTSDESHKYVNGMEFVYRRNYLNFERNNFNSCCLLRNKLYFGIFAKSIGIKTPKDLALIENGKILNISEKFKEISNMEFLALSDDMFCKSLDGENGVGVFHLQVQGGQFLVNGASSDIDSFIESLGDASYIVQEKIYQHEEVNRLYPTSINTIRVCTVRNLQSDKIGAWPSIFRVGAGGSHIDNGSQGGIMLDVNLETGMLNKYGYRFAKFGGGTRFTHHPDTNIEFATYQVPFIKEAIEQCIYFHSMLKDIHSIGWDVVITPEGPAFIEGNDDWEIVDSQLDHGVRDLFERDFF